MCLNCYLQLAEQMKNSRIDANPVVKTTLHLLRQLYAAFFGMYACSYQMRLTIHVCQNSSCCLATFVICCCIRWGAVYLCLVGIFPILHLNIFVCSIVLSYWVLYLNNLPNHGDNIRNLNKVLQFSKFPNPKVWFCVSTDNRKKTRVQHSSEGGEVNYLV